MLINKNSQLAAGSIYLFKLVGGEQIVAKIDNITDTAFVVSKPASFAFQGEQLALQPSMIAFDFDKPVSLYKTAVAMTAPPQQEIANMYVSQVSGVQLS